MNVVRLLQVAASQMSWSRTPLEKAVKVTTESVESAETKAGRGDLERT